MPRDAVVRDVFKYAGLTLQHDWCSFLLHASTHTILIWVYETGLKKKDDDESETDSSSDSSDQAESVGTLLAKIIVTCMGCNTFCWSGS